MFSSICYICYIYIRIALSSPYSSVEAEVHHICFLHLAGHVSSPNPFFCFSWEYHVRRSCQPIMGRPIAPAKHGYMILIYDIMYTWYYIYIYTHVSYHVAYSACIYSLPAPCHKFWDRWVWPWICRWEMPKSSQINMTLLTEDGDMDKRLRFGDSRYWDNRIST